MTVRVLRASNYEQFLLYWSAGSFLSTRCIGRNADTKPSSGFKVERLLLPPFRGHVSPRRGPLGPALPTVRTEVVGGLGESDPALTDAIY